MTASGPVRVIVEIESIEDAVRGRLAVEGSAAADFYGWLELIDRLERAIDPGPAGDREP